MLVVIISKRWDFCFYLLCLSVSSSFPVMNEHILWKNWFWVVCGYLWPLPSPWKALNVLLAVNKIKTNSESLCLSGEGNILQESSHFPWSPWRGEPKDTLSCRVRRPPLPWLRSLLPLLRNKARDMLPSALPSTLEAPSWDRGGGGLMPSWEGCGDFIGRWP